MTNLLMTTTAPWYIYAPVHILFGEGMITRLPATAIALGKRALVVTGPKVSQLPPVQQVIEKLQETMQMFYCYDRIDSEPTTQQVNEITGLAREHKVKVIIGIGDGSPMDAAKAAGVITGQV